jgi:hypothetical protein
MKLILKLAIVLFSFTAAATQVIFPPVTVETLHGSWEAITTSRPGDIDALWHMEIGAKDSNSYLAQVGPKGGVYMLWELLSSRVSNGVVTLHFIKPMASPDTGWRELWITGEGAGVATGGYITAKMFDSDPDKVSANRAFPESGGRKIYFEKGTWTRELAEASKEAEKAIKEKRANQ